MAEDVLMWFNIQLVLSLGVNGPSAGKVTGSDMILIIIIFNPDAFQAQLVVLERSDHDSSILK